MARTESQNPWAQWEEDAIRSAAAEGKRLAQIAPMFAGRRSWFSVRDKINNMGLGPMQRARAATVRTVSGYAPPSGPTLVEVYAPQESADEDEDAFLSRMLASEARSHDKAMHKSHARISITSDVPVGLVVTSDWHVAPKGTHISGLLDLADFVAETPDLYSVAVGDMFDNPIKHKGGSVGQVVDELRLLDIITGRYRGKMLGMTSGNHDDWSGILAGTDHLKTLAMRHDIHYAEDELLWTVEIKSPHTGEITASYYIATRHQWRNHSGLNPGHACLSWLRQDVVNWDPVPDVIAIGHNHVAAVGQIQFERKSFNYIRPGAWQFYSKFGAQKGYERYRATAPTVVMDPVRDGVANTLHCFADPHEAVRYMRGARDVTA